MYVLESLSPSVNDHHIVAVGRGKSTKKKMREEHGKAVVSAFYLVFSMESHVSITHFSMDILHSAQSILDRVYVFRSLFCLTFLSLALYQLCIQN